ncbi:efflux RND transporter periplasmic adaptor subunit [Stieleria sp. TO1_6]|uniref:efflux RND transporter periplasmic adaptor subunit n=1 Tax=Stieleria tagensis TaxID=2956795 RepID=UPI00209A8776|nr:efflux RND transporter periplasmic adaptor subunit [Stieleria tagensis]MCO8122132.1 efflux RND transporter periplasmic adaptor subunit [Stieleria tagensis]
MIALRPAPPPLGRFNAAIPNRRAQSPLMVSLLMACCLCSVTAAQDELPPVTAARIRVGQSNSSYQLLGTVTPSRKTTIGCALAGRVRELTLKRGARLEAGDSIAQLQTEVVKIELEAAKAQLRLVQHQLAELETGSRDEDIAEAKARMEAAAAIALRSSSQLQRIERLIESRAASADEVDVAIAEADSSKKLLLAETIAHQRLVAGPRAEQVAQAQASVDLQREQVRLLEDRLQKHTVIAPFDGYITAEYTEAGAWITAGAPVIDLIELDTVQVEVAVPAAQIVSLKPGQSIRIECSERPQELLLGTLERIVPSADTRARTFPILIRVENRIDDDIPILMSGMVVKIHLPVGPQLESTFVPTDAIVLEQVQQSVYVVDFNDQPTASQNTRTGTVRRVPVRLGIADGGSISVTGQLQPDELVVTRGNEGLTPGQTVEVTVVDG